MGPQKARMTTLTVVLFAVTRTAGNLCFHSERNLKVKCGICLVMEYRMEKQKTQHCQSNPEEKRTKLEA